MKNRVNILAVSTSGRAASAALIQDGACVLEKLSDAGLTHSETIAPLADELLLEAGLGFSDMDAFAADAGPGSFTGVRIGVCLVNAFAFAAGKPVIAISSLEALASGLSGSACPLIDARNGNGYAALYIDGEETLPPSPVVVSELLSTVPPGTLFTGDGAIIHRELISAAVPGARFAPQESALLRASMFAAPAYRAFCSNKTQKEAMPLYLRPTQAERMFKK